MGPAQIFQGSGHILWFRRIKFYTPDTDSGFGGQGCYLTAGDQLSGDATTRRNAQRKLISNSSKNRLPLVSGVFSGARRTHVVEQITHVLVHESVPGKSTK